MCASDSASNVWTNEAEALIRARAKFTLLADVIKDQNGAGVMQAREQQELRVLIDETVTRASSGRIIPSSF